MENGTFIDGLPSYKMVIFHGYVSHIVHRRTVVYNPKTPRKNEIPHSVLSSRPPQQVLKFTTMAGWLAAKLLEASIYDIQYITCVNK